MKVMLLILLFIGFAVLISCESRDSSHNHQVNTGSLDNENIQVDDINEWDVMSMGHKPPGRFSDPMVWSHSVHDINVGVVEFVMTEDIALRIGSIILRYITCGSSDEAHIVSSIEDKIYVITLLSSSIEGDSYYISVELSNVDGQVLKVNSNGWSTPIVFEMSQELALEIGDVILWHVFHERHLLDTVFIVAELPADNCFIVTRLPRYPVVLGGDVSVAIDSRDGRIIKAFMGE